jgi:hypothetical protein
MRRKIEEWTVSEIYGRRTDISFPEYQREPNLWSPERKALLIDTILRDIDIPKLYFNRVKDTWEVVDGQQRLWAIWDYLDGQYNLVWEGEQTKFRELSAAQQEEILNYKLQITVLSDAKDEYLRQLFLRLQLGLLLLPGEKLHASSGKMKEFVFSELAKHPFIEALGMPRRRYARETLCAQIAVNAYRKAKVNEFARTRYEDLVQFFGEYHDPRGADIKLFKEVNKRIVELFDSLYEDFGDGASELRNRSYILSVCFLFEHLRTSNAPKSRRKKAAVFVFELWKRLKEEGKSGFYRTNKELYEFETSLSSAPGERYQIERRHEKLLEYFTHFEKTGRIKGDR